MPSIVQDYFRQFVTNTPVLVITGNKTIVGWNLINPNSVNVYLKLYNAAAATDVTVGTTAVVKTILIPASGTVLLSNELNFQRAFNLGIVCAVTTGILDNSTAAPSSTCLIDLMHNTNV